MKRLESIHNEMEQLEIVECDCGKSITIEIEEGIDIVYCFWCKREIKIKELLTEEL